MSTTLELIKARQATKAAGETEIKLRQRQNQEELIELFAPIAKMWADVESLPFKAYRWHERGVVDAMQRLANVHKTVTTSIAFFGGDGRVGWQLIAERNEAGLPRIVHRFTESQTWKTVTIDEAKQLLIDFLADAIAPEALKPPEESSQ